MSIVRIRQFERNDIDPILGVCMAAFAPIHESFRSILGPDIFRLVYPDWRASHERYVRQLCDGSEANDIHVAVASALEVVGFIHHTIENETRTGKIGINAVAPDFQGRGVGSMMYSHVLGIMTERGVKLVQVSTGGDGSHEAARRAYEKAGFQALPLIQFYKTLNTQEDDQ